MTNPFHNKSSNLSDPGRDYMPVTPDDAAELPVVAVSLYIESAGAVSFESVTGQVRTVMMPDFGWLFCGVRRVLATGTTALGIHAITAS
jgi:hypothetical protein